MTRGELDRAFEDQERWLSSGEGQPADLSGADLTGEDLYEADFSSANLRGANLKDAMMCDAVLVDARLAHASLVRAFLKRSDMRGADLRDADLWGANLYNANLRGVRTNFITRMKTRGVIHLTDEQRAQLGIQPARARNARLARTTADLARRLRR